MNQWCVLLMCAGAASVAAAPADVQSLTSGVKKLGVEGAPGPLAVVGPQALPVVLGGVKEARLPLVAAGVLGQGRVVAFGHDGYLASGQHDGLKFLANAVRWAGGKPKPRVGVWQHRKAADALRAAGFDVREIDLQKLDDVDVLVVNAMRLRNASQAQAIHDRVNRGGGLITAGLGWAWIGYFSKGGRLADDFLGNQMLRGSGIAWADGTLKPTAGDGFAVRADVEPLAHAGRAFAALEAHDTGEKKLAPAELAQAAAAVTAAVGALPDSDPHLVQRVRALEARRGGAVVPTGREPVRRSQALDRLVLTWRLRQLQHAKARQTKAHPAAADFPGAVPENAPRVTQTVTVDTAVTGWHSTGLYAAPGETVIVKIPQAMAGKLHLRIGAHRDRLFHLDAWKRAPDITLEAPLKNVSTEAAGAFGGPVYVVVPEAQQAGAIEVAISGAVRAPLYVHGRTDVAQWKKTLRHHPAPWAEIGSDRVFLTVPSDQIRDLDDPAALMAAWNRVLDLDAELAGIPKRRPRPERFVVDRQISAGYMHSGYPIMAHLDQRRNLVDLDHLLKGNWGFFHELGHNHQRPDWTFAGTTEVTCNLFSLYVYEHLCGIKAAEYARTSAKARASRLKPYLEKPDFEKWKSSPFLALDMYVQLQEAFGWEPFKKVFAEFRDLPRNQRPKNDLEKRDQWMVRFGRAAGRNLGPFFEAWRVPTSAAARQSLADLPVWMPEEMN